MWIKRSLVLMVFLSLILLCACQTAQVDDAMQYIILSPRENAPDPEKPAPTALSGLMERLEGTAEDWPGIISAWALTSRNESVSVSGVQGRGTAACLIGVSGNPAALPALLPRFGRNFYPEELSQGAPVMLLDEQLAIDLFRIGDPIDQMVVLDGVEFRVIGILRHRRSPGERMEYSAYVPLLALNRARYQTETLAVSARPIAGSGAASQFRTDMNAWQAGGNLHLLAKERERAFLPLRALITAIGFFAALEIFRQLKRIMAFFYRDYRFRLQSQFAAQLLPRLGGYALLGVALCGLWLIFVYGLASFALEIVYIFPEWIPAVPVEGRDIAAAFWENQAAVTGSVELRSAELLTFRFYHAILTALCTGAAFLLFGWYREWKGTQRKISAKS